MPDVPEDALAVGTRIRARRVQRGMSRRAVAELVGRSEEWLRQIERGIRPLDSISAAARLAGILRLDVVDLLFGEAPAEGGRRRSALGQQLRTALLDVPLPPARPGRLGLPRWRQQLDRLWQAWRDGENRYTATLDGLPDVVRALRRSPAAGPEHAATLLDAYHLARSVLSRVGRREVGLLAADRGVAVTQNMPDRLVRLIALRNLAMAYAQNRALAEARDLAVRGRDLCGDTPEDLVVRGSLLLLAAKAAARLQERGEALSLLHEAADIADQLGGDHEYRRVQFGPSALAVARMSAAVSTGHLAEALRISAHAAMAPGKGVPVSLMLDYFGVGAVAHARRREDAAAMFALLKIEQLSPEEARYGPAVIEALKLLLPRDSGPIRQDLRRLARGAQLAA